MNTEEEVKKIETVMIPYSVLGVIFAIILQTMGAIWWASGITFKIDYLQKTQQEFNQSILEGTKNRYTSIDATRDWNTNEKRLGSIEADIKSISLRIQELPPKWFQDRFEDVRQRVDKLERKR